MCYLILMAVPFYKSYAFAKLLVQSVFIIEETFGILGAILLSAAAVISISQFRIELHK